MTSSPPGQRVAVVICAYTERRFDDVLAAYGSVRAQTRPADEIVLVVDHNDALLHRLRQSLPGARVISNALTQGLSGARNTGVAQTTADIVLFLDDDAAAAPDWLERLSAVFDDIDVIGVGGSAHPVWTGAGRPRWFPEPFLWVVGCSYQGQPTELAEIRNPIGSSMGFRRSALTAVGGFSDGIGRVGNHPVGCEETELSIKATRAVPGSRILIEPAAVVAHKVSADRNAVRYFVRRCYWEGVSKAIVARVVGAGSALESEKAYTTRTLPAAFFQGWARLRRGDVFGPATATMVAVGLLTTTTGYLRGRVAKNRAATPVAPIGSTASAGHPDALIAGPLPSQRTSTESRDELSQSSAALDAEFAAAFPTPAASEVASETNGAGA